MAGQTVIVSILADTKKFSRAMKGLSKEIGLTRLGDGFANVGRKVAGFLTGTVKLAGAAGVAIAGLAIKGGFQRALNIEDAQLALEGLGHDTKSIETIMDSALASVKGTAFGLGDAATIASTAVAAGIEPGDKLTRTLKLTANAAALTKTGLSEMGSILNKVWTSGRVGTQELNQLADRGVPIWTSLADHYGVAADELRKMVSAGKVDAATFADVLESTVGTAADTMGTGVRGMAQNVMAALSRVGEGFVSKLLPTIKDSMSGAMDALDGIAPVVAEMGETFGKWITGTAIPAVKSLGRWLSGTLWPALRQVWQLVSGAFRQAFEAVSAALSDAGVSADKTGKTLGDTVVKAVRTLGPILAGVVRTIGNFVAWLIRSRDILTPIAVAIGTVVAMITVFNKVMAIARAVQLAFNIVMAANPIGLIITAVAALVAGLVYFFTQTETGKKIVEDVWGGIQTAIEAVTTWWTDTAWPAIKAGWEWITGAFETGNKAIEKFLGQAWDFIKKVWSWSPLGLIIGNWDKITAAFNTGKKNVTKFLQQAWDFIKKVWSYTPIGLITGNWDKIMQFFRDIPGKVREVFSGAGQWLYQAGRDILQGLLDGVTGMLSRVRDVARDIGSSLTNGVKNALGIRSPSRVFRDLGRDTLRGLQDGLARTQGLRRVVVGVADVVTDAFDPRLTVEPATATGGTGSAPVTINVYALADGPEVGRRVNDALASFIRLNGKPSWA